MTALMAAPGFGPGSRIAVSYRADPTLWHERIVLRHLGDGRYLVLTPDLEIQQALRVSTGNPLLAVRLLRDNGTILGVTRDNIYFFEDSAGAISEAEIQEYITEAAGLAVVLGYMEIPLDPPLAGVQEAAPVALGAPHGVGPPPGLLPPPLGTLPGGIVATAMQRGATPGGGGPGDDGAGSFRGDAGGGAGGDGGGQAGFRAGHPGPPLDAQWVVAESRGDVAAGTLAPPGAVCMLATDFGVWTHVDFGDIFIYRRGSPTPIIDQRTLSTVLDSRKRRYREFKDAIDLTTEFEQADWDIAGPRTTLWLLRHMFRFGGTPVAHHHRWLAEVRLGYSAAGVAEHLGRCKFFEQAACYDQLNLGQLAAAGLGARRLQMIA